MKKLLNLKKLLTLLCCLSLAAATAQAGVLLQDSLNYPYTNGCIEGQGQWYCYTPATPNLDAFVTNNVLYLSTSNKDSVATPTNGFYNVTNGTITFASFTFNASKLPTTTNGGYFCVFQDTNQNSVCHVFFDTVGVQTPGTYRLGVANFASTILALGTMNYPQDLATGVTYTVVIAYDKYTDSPLVGASLWINPSAQDFTNSYNGDTTGVAFGTDTTTSTNLLNINIAQIGFSPYANAGISNVIVGTAFADVNTTNLPVIGIQPQSTTNYSGNSLTLYTVASGVDLTYQWYSNLGVLVDDGVNVIGSASNVLTLNNLTGANNLNYYCVATDAYGNTVTTANAVTTVITTPTPPFFPATVVAQNLTNNLFTSTGFTNTALGTGPLTYQWFFAPTNLPITYSALPGQNSPALNLFLGDYSYQGSYYLAAYNSVNGSSVAFGPTNTITELAPVVATLAQLHAYENSIVQSQGAAALKNNTVYVNTNNVNVSGYVTSYGGVGSSYTQFQIQDAAGFGAEVYYSPLNIYTPPVGTYVTITGPVALYNTQLELKPATLAAIATNTAPVIPLPPVLANSMFNDLCTNALGTNALNHSLALVTFTNVYLYGSSKGLAFGNGGTHSGVGGIFYSNGYTALYFTVGAPYNVATGNTNLIEDFQPTYSYPQTTNTPNNPFYGLTIPTHLYQLTGVYDAYNGGAEVIPSRPADYVVNPPGAYTTSIATTQKLVNLTWPVQTGSTYSVQSATNLLGPWTNVAYGLSYYPGNGTYTETNNSRIKFYRVSTP